MTNRLLGLMLHHNTVIATQRERSGSDNVKSSLSPTLRYHSQGNVLRSLVLLCNYRKFFKRRAKTVKVLTWLITELFRAEMECCQKSTEQQTRCRRVDIPHTEVLAAAVRRLVLLATQFIPY